MLRLLPKLRVGGIPGPEAYQIKMIRPRRRLRRKFTSKNEASPTWAPLPNPKIKLFFFKVRAFKFYLLTSISALLSPNCSISSCQKLVETIQNYIKEFWLILKNEFGALILSVLSVLPRKMGQNERFSTFNLQILSSNFNLRTCFVKLFNFKLSKTCWKSPKF